MKKSLFLGMAALLMASMSSCSSDDVAVKEDLVLDHDQSFFAYINIGDVNSIMRAAEGEYDADNEPKFDKGNEVENAIKSIYLIFYDEDSTRVATTQVMKDNLGGGTFDNNTSTNENSIYSGVVQIDIKHGSKQPRYVMCFVNPITSQNFEVNPDFATLDALQRTTKSRIIDASDNFAMSKSVYYGINRAKTDENGNVPENKPENYERIIATPIPNGHLFRTKEALDEKLEESSKADSQTEDPTIDIYVERYAVKVNFSVADNANTTLDLEDKVENSTKLVFVPEYWAVNAYETDTYVCKSFLSEDGETPLGYQALNTALGSENGLIMPWFWNSPEHHRSYWAQTPAYYKKAYPRVADDLTDGVSYAAEDYALGYYSYEDIKYNAENDGEWTYLSRKARKVNEKNTGGEFMPIYARENTVAGKALIEAYNNPMASPKAAVASVVLVGHYEIQGTDKNTELGEGEFFYIMGNATNGYTFFENKSKMINHFINTTIPFYYKMDENSYAQFYNYGVTNNGFKEGMEEKFAKYFDVKHPGPGARGYGFENLDETLVIDSRFVTIQLNEGMIPNANSDEGSDDLYVYLEGRYQRVTKNIIDQVNQQMLYAAGTVQGFNGGKAYFNIPIKHLGFYRKGNANAGKSGTEIDFDWTKVKSGDFGLVRNHVYTITVDHITGLGNAIPNPEDPIVPPTDPEEYYIGARIIVLNWAVVPDQHVTL